MSIKRNSSFQCLHLHKKRKSANHLRKWFALFVRLCKGSG